MVAFDDCTVLIVPPIIEPVVTPTPPTQPPSPTPDVTPCKKTTISCTYNEYNHKNYNFLDCDWFEKTPIFH